jgi:hypothetical protein
MATCGCLADIERVDLDELRRQYPEAMNRTYHSCAGTDIDSFLYKGEK